jgi:uncharacterized protein YggE
VSGAAPLGSSQAVSIGSTRRKDSLIKRATLILAGALALLLASCSDGGGESTTIDVADTVQSGIAVTGVGEVFGAPDTLTLTIGVQVTEPTVEEAGEVAAASTAAVIEALVDSGIDSDDIQTQQFTIYPEYDYSSETRELIGFTVTNTVVAKLRDIDEAGSTIDGAVTAGGDAVIVEGVGFSIEDDAERLAEARERAWADAAAKAEQLAELAGVELGAAVQISEGVGSQPVARAVFDEAAASAPIEAGQVASTVVLNVRFAVKTD